MVLLLPFFLPQSGVSFKELAGHIGFRGHGSELEFAFVLVLFGVFFSGGGEVERCFCWW